MLPDVALGAVLAALITGALTYAGLILAKEQKVSEFRQAWIDALRQDIADTYAAMSSLADLDRMHKTVDERYETAFRGIYDVANRATARIRLRLNPDEDASKELLLTLNAIERHLNASFDHDDDLLERLEGELLQNGGRVLKQEWEIVKHGEPVFRRSKVVAVAAMTMTTIIGLCYIISKS